MKNYPSMISEVCEAIEEFFKDDEDIASDCMLYLLNIVPTKNCLTIEHWFNKHDRCPECGSKYEYAHYKEPHPELDGCPMENMCEQVCPECDGFNQIRNEDFYD